MQWNNYPHIAAQAFNQPLLLEPAYARVFFAVLGERMGAGLMVDGMTGEKLAVNDIQRTAFLWDDDRESGNKPKLYDVRNGIAVLPITGTLVHKFGYVQPLSGITGYDGIITRLQAAMADSSVVGVMLDIDSPGGQVAGAFDTADLIARYRNEKPIWALANDMACSAAQLLASACTRRLITQTSFTGSIGVLVAHRSYEKQLQQAGVDVTLIYSGSHKVDGNPFQALPAQVKKELQTSIDENRRYFAEKVASYTGLNVSDVMATEAAVFEGREAIDVGLADELVNYADAVSLMAKTLTTGKNRIKSGVSMNTKASNTTTDIDLSDDHPGNGGEGQQATLDMVVSTAVTAERERVLGIIGCDAAQGREAQALQLAKIPGMTLEQANLVLLASPLGAQVRTDTSLDQLMKQESPSAVSTEEVELTGGEMRISGLIKAGKSVIGGVHHE